MLKLMGKLLPDYWSPLEIASALGEETTFNVLNAITGRGRNRTIELFAWRAQGRYWTPNRLAEQFINSGVAVPEPIPKAPDDHELPGYYSPVELAKLTQLSHVRILQECRGRPERQKPPTLFAYQVQGRYWIPENRALEFIRHKTQQI